ncbi:MAG: tRNA (adenine(22)-N(1))-methyltransferase TrmK [Bacilli bacterium]|nr:tRNA (adenine(22)-N(1))-methyltransferase TrmK [Bacilli bacterium]
MKLKPRLQAIADLIENNSKIIDVGADHGLLDIYLSKYKNCTCLATDISSKCIQRAILNSVKYQTTILTKVNNGLENLKLKNEIIVISGMGTRLIKKILNRDIKNELIISSHTNIEELKDFLIGKNYKIIKEIKIKEKKEYTIIQAKTVN